MAVWFSWALAPMPISHGLDGWEIAICFWRSTGYPAYRPSQHVRVPNSVMDVWVSCVPVRTLLWELRDVKGRSRPSLWIRAFQLYCVKGHWKPRVANWISVVMCRRFESKGSISPRASPPLGRDARDRGGVPNSRHPVWNGSLRGDVHTSPAAVCISPFFIKLFRWGS